MKKHHFLFGLLGIIFLALGCKKNIQEQLTEDLALNMNFNSFLQHQVHVQFVNANYENSTTLPNVKVNIVNDKDNQVFDINGTKEISVEDQFAMMVVSPGKPLPESKPAVFSIRAEAPGFLPFQQEIRISNLDTFTYLTFHMVELANPPAGIRLEKNQSGTEMVIFDATNTDIRSGINGLIQNNSNMVERNGVIEESSLQPIAYMSVTDETVTGNQLAALKQPEPVDVSLPANLVDPVSGNPFKVNETLELYQKGKDENIWHYVSDVKVTGNTPASLKASLLLNGPGDVLLTASTPPKCSSYLGLRFTRLTGANTLHYIEVINASTNAVLLNASSVPVENNLNYNFTSYLPNNTNVRVRVYEFETSQDKGRIVALSPIFLSCSFNTTNRLVIAVDPQKTSNNPVARFELDTYCATTKTVYYHDGRTLYRPAGKNVPFKDLGLARKNGTTTNVASVKSLPGQPGYSNTAAYSYLEADRLQFLPGNARYVFRTTITGPHRTSKRTITKTYDRERAFKPVEYTTMTAPNASFPGGYYYFGRQYWFAPNTACADFGY